MNEFNTLKGFINECYLVSMLRDLACISSIPATLRAYFETFTPLGKFFDVFWGVIQRLQHYFLFNGASLIDFSPLILCCLALHRCKIWSKSKKMIKQRKDLKKKRLFLGLPQLNGSRLLIYAGHECSKNERKFWLEVMWLNTTSGRVYYPCDSLKILALFLDYCRFTAENSFLFQSNQLSVLTLSLFFLNQVNQQPKNVNFLLNPIPGVW